MSSKTRKLLVIGIILIAFLFLISHYGVSKYAPYSQDSNEQNAFYCTRIFFFFRDHFFGLWEVIDHSHDVLIASGTIGLLIVTTALAFYTYELWGSTKDLVEKTEETARTELRAYVKASPCPPGIQIGSSTQISGMEGLTCNLEIRNYGQTPATVTDVITKAVILTKTDKLPQIPEYGEAGNSGLFGTFLVKDESFFKLYGEFAPIGTNIGNVKTGEIILYFYGYVDYIDAFRQRHRGGFGRVFYPAIDDRSLYKTEEDFTKRCNLIFLSQGGYNYDRPRKKGEGNDWDEYPPS
jgi:hypothetical protein